MESDQPERATSALCAPHRQPRQTPFFLENPTVLVEYAVLASTISKIHTHRQPRFRFDIFFMVDLRLGLLSPQMLPWRSYVECASRHPPFGVESRWAHQFKLF